MVFDIKMCRFDNVPWGFRLVGGSDFEYPLTVVKVTENSIAEAAGLRVGDIIVRINDTAASPLTHDEANKTIKGCGNVFYFGICRENPETDIEPQRFPLVAAECAEPAESLQELNNQSETTAVEVNEQPSVEYLPELLDRPSSVLSETSERQLVENEIAAVLSGESEVLREHQVLGIFPKSGVCMSSEVLRTLNDEAIKTKAEKDKENKKWTTFLQRPNRPIPKSKQQLEAERRAANAYKVQIVKSAPKTPERSVSPVVQPPKEDVKEPTPPKVEPEPQSAADQEPEADIEVEAAALTDSEVPNLIETSIEEDEVEEQIEKATDEEKTDKEKEAGPENKETEEEQKAEINALSSNERPTEEFTSPQKTEEELALERQLADVQRQLAALSSLPSTIQTTLDAVTKQLADILPAFKLQQVKPVTEMATAKEVEVCESDTNLEQIEEQVDEAKEDTPTASAGEKLEDEQTNEQQNKELMTLELTIVSGNRNDQSEVNATEDEASIKKQKRQDVIEELEEHLERKQHPKQRSKRAFGPLTPSSERPLVLPGGRRWYRPKDAYNDEFIAETLSAQAELITGTTLGSTYESPLLGYDSRVNFMKYQKPERKIDLNRSEVYKVIHHLDRQPVRGIEVRPPMVPAAVDIKPTIRM